MRVAARLLAFAATAVLFTAPTGAMAQNKANLGVSIPAATHGFTAGIVWWANEAKKELERQHQNLKVTIKTAYVDGPRWSSK